MWNLKKTKEFYAVKFFSARELGLNIQITNAWTSKPSMTFSIAKLCKVQVNNSSYKMMFLPRTIFKQYNIDKCMEI